MIINGYSNQIQIDIISLIVILGVIQGFILSIILLQFKNNKKSNLYLSLFVLFASISISGAIIYKTNLFFLIPHMIRINEPFRFLIAPFFYFYIKSLISINFKFKKKYFLHFIPFILNVIYFIPFYTKSAQDKIQYMIDQKSFNNNNMVLENQVFLLLVLISILIYIIFININIKKHEENIKENFSSIEKINLLWIKKFSLFFLIIGIIILIIIFAWIFVIPVKEFYRLTPVIVTISIYVLAYRAVKQPEIFRSNINLNNEDEKSILIKKDKFKKLVIPDNKIDEYYEKLIDFMKNEKPYLNEELTLPQLAEDLKIPIRYLSDVINEKSGFNFYFFINKYRIEEVKELFKKSKDKDISVLDIAFEAGFNSKSTFNAIFKQFTNMTPTEFKKNI